MKLKKFRFRSVLIFSLSTLIILTVAESILIHRLNKKNSQQFVFVQAQDNVLVPLNDIYFKSVKYHNCINKNKTIDSFYECKIMNNSDTDFTNWQINIELVGDVRLKSCWNADAYLNGKLLTIKSNSKLTDVIKSNTSYSFELYLNYKTKTAYNTVTITGNKIHKLREYPLHIIITILFGIVTVALIAAAIVSNYMQREINVLNRITKRSYAIIDQTMKTFVNFIDAKDEYTKGHSTRVAEYSRLITKKMGFDEQFQQDMYYMGLMHDIGKITVPDNILNKTSHLTTDEWSVIQMHTENGARLLQNFTIIPEIRDAVLYHHERYDGKGYLFHLKGDDIPLCARIICVADSYDAMSTTRCYRIKYSKERIIQELERCSGKQFDPAIATVMIDLIKEGTI